MIPGIEPIADFFGHSAPMQALYARMELAVRARRTTLIRGPTGSGKEVAARRMHRAAFSGQRPFVGVSCAALPESLVESELFGHRAGAFTGATSERQGLIAAAEGGTLLLDDVDTLTPAAQARLLRFFDTGAYRPLGSDREQISHCWVMASTNADLDQLVAERRFRPDLLFRLDVVRIDLPPLTDRGDDVELLAMRFLEQIADPVPELMPCARRAMRAHTWPGNVRELRHRVERAALQCDHGRIRAADLDLVQPPPRVTSEGLLHEQLWRLITEHGLSLQDALDTCEQAIMRRALEAENANRTRAAARLGINVRTLFKKLARP